MDSFNESNPQKVTHMYNAHTLRNSKKQLTDMYTKFLRTYTCVLIYFKKVYIPIWNFISICVDMYMLTDFSLVPHLEFPFLMIYTMSVCF